MTLRYDDRLDASNVTRTSRRRSRRWTSHTRQWLASTCPYLTITPPQSYLVLYMVMPSSPDTADDCVLRCSRASVTTGFMVQWRDCATSRNDSRLVASSSLRVCCPALTVDMMDTDTDDSSGCRSGALGLTLALINAMQKSKCLPSNPQMAKSVRTQISSKRIST